eukprot:2828548-Alexandrium_andersonii.AAC.1
MAPSVPSMETRANRLMGKSRAPSWARRLSRSSQRTARPWWAISSRMPAQTSRSDSANRVIGPARRTDFDVVDFPLSGRSLLFRPREHTSGG